MSWVYLVNICAFVVYMFWTLVVFIKFWSLFTSLNLILIAFRNYGTSISKPWKHWFVYILTLRRLRRYNTGSLFLSYKSVNYFNLVILFMNLSRSIVAFLLIPFCVLIHFVLATKFEVYESKPLWAIVVISASLIVLLRLLVKSKAYKKSIFFVLSVIC